MNVQHIAVDVSKAAPPREPLRIRQGDVGGLTVVADVYDNGVPLDLTGMTAQLVVRLPGGAHYARDAGCEVDGSTITYVMDEAHFAAIPGRTEQAYFRILQGVSVVASTQDFAIEVLRSATDGAELSEDYDNAIDEALAELAEAIEDAEALTGPTASVSKSGTTSTLTVTDARGTTEVEIQDGATGATGPAGASATIEAVTATVDSGTGTPSVDVNLGGTSLARTIAMVFHNLKGAKGDPGTVTPVTTSQIDNIVADTSVTSDNALTGTGLTYLWSKLKAAFAAATHSHAAGDVTSGTLGVARGGTGKDTHTANAVLTGNGASAMGNVATADGALYATAANGAAQFGTLPVAQGGTGATSASGARTNLDAAQANGATGTLKSAEDGIGDLTESIATVEQGTATANHASGSHFMLGNELRKATSAIATGESITSSNSAADTLQGQIDTLRDSVSSSVPYVDLGERTSIGDAWDALTIYDRPVICRYGQSGKVWAILYKYSDGQYGMGISQRYFATSLSILSVVNNNKTTKTISGT